MIEAIIPSSPCFKLFGYGEEVESATGSDPPGVGERSRMEVLMGAVLTGWLQKIQLHHIGESGGMFRESEGRPGLDVCLKAFS